jgi:hypothetical protein
MIYTEGEVNTLLNRIAFLEGKIEGMLEMHNQVVESLQNEIKRLKDK